MARHDEMQFPDLVIGFHDVVIAIDHQARRAWVFSSGFSGSEAANREQLAIERLDHVLRRIELTVTQSQPAPANGRVELQSNFTQPSYETAVERVINYILAGDIFQANLSQCLQARLPEDLTGIDLYRRLRKINPAPFAALIKSGDVEIVSASPERFLKLQQGQVETCPIKGTRPRGSTPAGGRGAGGRASRQREGPRRERDDRRSPAQRSLPRLPRRLGRRAAAVRARDLRHGVSSGLDGHRRHCSRARPRSICWRPAFPAARSPAPRRSGRWRSSPSSSRRGAAPIAAASAISASTARWIPASPSAPTASRAGSSRSRRAAASSRIPARRTNMTRRSPRRGR